MSLTQLFDTLTANRAAASQMMADWQSSKRGQITSSFGALLSGAVSAADAEEMAAALAAALRNIDEHAGAIFRSAGSAEHIIDKGRRKIRAAADAPAGFRFD